MVFFIFTIPSSTSPSANVRKYNTSSFPLPPLPLPQRKLQSGGVSAEAQAKLIHLAGLCAAYDFVGAQKAQTELARIDWDNTKEWQKGVRNLVTLCLVKSGRR